MGGRRQRQPPWRVYLATFPGKHESRTAVVRVLAETRTGTMRITITPFANGVAVGRPRTETIKRDDLTGMVNTNLAKQVERLRCECGSWMTLHDARVQHGKALVSFMCNVCENWFEI
jgi:hypothetical protein